MIDKLSNTKEKIFKNNLKKVLTTFILYDII